MHTNFISHLYRDPHPRQQIIHTIWCLSVMLLLYLHTQIQPDGATLVHQGRVHESVERGGWHSRVCQASRPIGRRLLSDDEQGTCGAVVPPWGGMTFIQTFVTAAPHFACDMRGSNSNVGGGNFA